MGTFLYPCLYCLYSDIYAYIYCYMVRVFQKIQRIMDFRSFRAPEVLKTPQDRTSAKAYEGKAVPRYVQDM